MKGDSQRWSQRDRDLRKAEIQRAEESKDPERGRQNPRKRGGQTRKEKEGRVRDREIREEEGGSLGQVLSSSLPSISP